jgi:hypothetical protein
MFRNVSPFIFVRVLVSMFIFFYRLEKKEI